MITRLVTRGQRKRGDKQRTLKQPSTTWLHQQQLNTEAGSPRVMSITAPQQPLPLPLCCCRILIVVGHEVSWTSPYYTRNGERMECTVYLLEEKRTGNSFLGHPDRGDAARRAVPASARRSALAAAVCCA